jgi:hypothetical protein
MVPEQLVEPDGTLIETATVTQLEIANGHSRQFEKLGT